MSRTIWLVAGVVTFGLAILSVGLGVGLVPSQAAATEKGVLAGWYVVWAVIWIAVLATISLAVFLIAAGLGKVPETRS